ncbi:DegT/DnrJ/EryC1/StrS family aminotransferase [Nocardioides marmorisolisilvae]|uniref:DegT/DnrJ/EryC1/StrS family aminotransferase n=1 Tax=Nocardioides marmorisolisilvae TaxID=1542737 RepID=A0A3N0DU62_9ACTN|nr:DegT/DnrJ/EryC1/StrS family aminotransferase [Nocardioides marmorisolisilvae]RNL79061.1 DegT/DnrJ/EryC1/StrS family aminotransferase [Nocardioides marmorisolisilvae]
MTDARIAAVVVELGEEEREAALGVLTSGKLVQGEQVAAFESEFSEALVAGAECIAVNSGTSALHLGLIAAGIGPGDEVIVPSFTFAASANSVVMAGATPVFADIDPASFGLDPVSVEKAITPRTRAVMPVHLYGHPADMTALNTVAENHGLVVVEDACQSHGALLDGRPVGSLGDVAAFSFYATKNMTTGEGGMVVCRDPEVARRVRLLRNQGMERRYENEVAGLNNRMTEVAAAIGRIQLTRLPAWNARRREIAAAYDAGLTTVVAPPVAEGVEPVYHQYTVRSSERDRLLEVLAAANIDAAVYYPTPTHRLPSYGDPVLLPETDRAAAEVLSLPIRPGLTDAEVDRVIATCNSLGGSRG